MERLFTPWRYDYITKSPGDLRQSRGRLRALFAEAPEEEPRLGSTR